MAANLDDLGRAEGCNVEVRATDTSEGVEWSGPYSTPPEPGDAEEG